MKKIFGIISIFLVFLLVFTACKKTDLEKAREDYDFSSFVPVISEIDGPTFVVRTQQMEYSVFPRGGSTFQWTAENAILHAIDGTTAKVEIEFDQAVDSVVVTCVETTSEGVKSQTATLTVEVGPYCELDINVFVGAFDCDEEGYGVYPCNFTLDGTVSNRILNDNFWDWAAAGEVIYYDFDGTINQQIDIPQQAFEFGDGTVGSVEGSGTYSTCDSTFVCDYDVEYGGTIYPTHHEFSPSGSKNLLLIGEPRKKAFLNK